MSHQGYAPLPQSGQAPPSSTSQQLDPSVVIEPYRPEVTAEWLPPPPATKPFGPEQPPQALTEAVLDTRPFSEEDARECLDSYIKSTWFSRRGFARDLLISQISSSNAYVAELETFLESRKLTPDYRPMRELIHTLDGPNMGPAPGPWQIEAHPRTLFADMDLSIQVPHTEEVRVCHNCRGRGDVICSFCHGHGHITCSTCHGTGHRTVHKTDSNGVSRSESEHCSFCHHGHRDCSTCARTGYVRCTVCDGYRNLIHFLRLDIAWRNKRQRAVIDAEDDQLDANERTRLTSSDAIRGAQGPLVFAEEDVVLPLRNANDLVRVNPGVNGSVNRLLEAAVDASQLQHRQRLMIRGLPMYKVSYLDKGVPHNFWVVGTNRTVHAPHLPLDMMRVSIAALLCLLLIAAIVGGIGALVYFVVLK